MIDRTVIVTGGTQGIGEAIVMRMSAAGANVLFVGRDVSRGNEVARNLADGAGAVHFFPADLSDPAAPDAVVEEALRQFGRLDALVNNAGILRPGTALETSDEDWNAMFGVNVDAVFRMSRAALRVFVPQRRGAVVNIASEWGVNGEVGHVAYCASKGAVLQMTRAMALDPPLLFLDEPSAGLDPITSAGLDKLIVEIARETGTTFVVVTHELQSILAIGDRCIMLDKDAQGMIAEGDPKRLGAESAHPTVRAFFRREVMKTEAPAAPGPAPEPDKA
jgi:hypothetical protein